MRTLIFRTISPAIVALMVLFSIFVCLRGHNEPGGGFIGGLMAASALAIYGISHGVPAVRRAIHFHPMAIAGFGLFFGILTGLLSWFTDEPFFTGQWAFLEIFGTSVALSTPMFFDIGVYFVVVGAITSIALALEEDQSAGRAD
jgi:multicomponent Na+:H+ antiporter subunit B